MSVQVLLERLMMNRPGDNVLEAVGCKDTPKFLLNSNPAEKRIIHYLLGCFHRKLQEDARWKVCYLVMLFLCSRTGVPAELLKQLSCQALLARILYSVLQDKYDLLAYYLRQCEDMIVSYTR